MSLNLAAAPPPGRVLAVWGAATESQPALIGMDV
jgi:hypothetical protein